jgi:hypothetical protein
MTQKFRVTIMLEGDGFNVEQLEQDLQRFVDEDTRESIDHLSTNEITITEVEE